MNIAKLSHVPVTYAPRKFLTLEGEATKGHDKERLLWWADNCIKLAKLLLDVPPDRHDQGDWVEDNKPPCKTSACAMGWAALRHVTPGLQYHVQAKKNSGYYDYEPLVNGQPCEDFMEAGALFFGDEAAEDIFMNATASRTEVIGMLYEQATDYRRQATCIN